MGFFSIQKLVSGQSTRLKKSFSAVQLFQKCFIVLTKFSVETIFDNICNRLYSCVIHVTNVLINNKTFHKITLYFCAYQIASHSTSEVYH